MTVVVLAMITWDVFLLYALIRMPRLQKPWSIMAAVVLGLTLLAFNFSITFSRIVTDWDRWRPLVSFCSSLMPVFFYLLFGTGIIWLIYLIWSIRQPKAPKKPSALIKTPRIRFVRKALVVAILTALTVTAFGYWGAHHPTTRPINVTLPNLPAQFNGFKIALITDIHASPTLGRDFVQGIVDQTNQAEPDLIVIVGDLAEGNTDQAGPALEPLTDLLAPFGVYAAFGNHDFYSHGQSWIDWLEARQIHVLANEGVVLTRGLASIDLLGIADRTAPSAYRPDLQAAADQLHRDYGVPVNGDGRCRILLAHQPIQVFDQNSLAAKLGVDLQLSGHTHGGQLWPFSFAVGLQQPMVSGVKEIAGVTVVTSRGAGAWWTPVRVGAPAEIPIVVLHRV